ncbi:hypothetical protein C8J57DRAFT_1704769 [Mycena rebaudengoi]|nr:hypothetical protein C8J57DRAFT_1704769 [Mycena rebaudengoi]
MAEVVGLVASILQLVDTFAKACLHIKNMRDAPMEQRRLVSEVHNLKPLLKEMQRRMPDGHSTGSVATEQLKASLVKLEKTVKYLTVRFDTGSGPLKFSKRLTWTLWSKEYAIEDLDRIERFKSLLNSWLGMDVWSAAQEREREMIVQWFSPLNFFPKQNDIFDCRQEGTGEWFVKHPEFKDWRDSPGKTLFCHGMAGAGKTVLASVAVEHLNQNFKRQSVGVAVIYCNHKEIEQQSASNLLASVWRQLVFGRYLSGDVHDLYLQHGEHHTRPSMHEIIGVLRSAIAGYFKVFVVVDALDECPNDKNTRDTLLSRLSTLGLTVNLLFTSRPHVDIENTFPDAKRMEIRASEDDIRCYVQGQIARSSRLAKHVRARPNLREEITRSIIGLADGMFLLVKLHMDSLSTKITVRAVREALKGLPKDLDGTYDEAMQRIAQQSEDDRNLALQILSWISNAMRPLSASELQEALAVRLGTMVLDIDGLPDMDIMLSVCAGLVVFDQSGKIVRLIHYTAQHYFDRNRDRRFPDARKEIADVCLTYLCFETFTHVPPIMNNSDTLRLCDDHALLAYAAEYGLVHAHGGGGGGGCITAAVPSGNKQALYLRTTRPYVRYRHREP